MKLEVTFYDEKYDTDDYETFEWDDIEIIPRIGEEVSCPEGKIHIKEDGTLDHDRNAVVFDATHYLPSDESPEHVVAIFCRILWESDYGVESDV